MSDDIGTSATEAGKGPDKAVTVERDQIDAFIRSSLLGGHPPGKIAIALERQRSGLGRASLASIQALALQIDTGRRSGVSNSASFTGREVAEMPPATSNDLGLSKDTAGLQKLPELLTSGQNVPHLSRTIDAPMLKIGLRELPLRNNDLAAPRKAGGGLLRLFAPKSEPIPPMDLEKRTVMGRASAKSKDQQ